MSKIFARIIDEDGIFQEDAFVKHDELTELTIETPCPSGFYLPKWDFENEEWVEGGEVPEPTIPEPNEAERLENLENTVMEMMMDLMSVK